MSIRIGGNTTLPSIDLSSNAEVSDGLVLSVLSHPDPSRIGEAAVLSRGIPSRAIELGRDLPLFRRRHGQSKDAPRGLEEPHISRLALTLLRSDDGLRLLRPRGASRLCTAQGDITESLMVSMEQLRQGLALQLGHGVVLCLRYAALVDEDEGEAPAGLLGTSDSMATLRRSISLAAASGADVLIGGESGSGKERVAQALHALSDRSAGPLVPVNMAALPAELAAAALFGNTRGAFTGATTSRPGLFQQAEHGSLFLDEIGDAPASVQPLLLRALQEREVQVVGGATQKVDVRVIAATDVDIDAPASGFRGALRHRLAAVELQVPSLREHPEDIGLLAWHFYQRHSPGEDGAGIYREREPLESARWAELTLLLAHQRWSGNVRQLENLMRQLAIESPSGLNVPRTLMQRLKQGLERAAESSTGARGSDISEQRLKTALADCNYEIAATARELGVSRQSIYRRVQAADDLQLAAEVPLEELLAALESARGDLDLAARELKVSVTALRARVRTAPLTFSRED